MSRKAISKVQTCWQNELDSIDSDTEEDFEEDDVLYEPTPEEIATAEAEEIDSDLFLTLIRPLSR